MNKMGTGLFWGLILIIIGVSLLIKVIFNINFPIFRIVIAFIFIYIGIKILVGPSIKLFHTQTDKNGVIFGETSQSSIQNNQEYNAIFGKLVFDLKNIELNSDTNYNIKINTVFGSCELILPENVNINIESNAVFGLASMPNGNSTSFGNIDYKKYSPEFHTTLFIKADVVFGSFIVKQ